MKKLLLVLLILFGCKSVKKDVTKTTQSIEQESTEKSNRQIHETIQINKGYSGHETSRSEELSKITIYPKGTFQISENGSFQGEADSLSFMAAVVRRSEVQYLDTTRQETTKNTVESTERAKKLESIQKENNKVVTRKPNLIPYLGLGIVVIGVLWFLFLKLKPSKF